VVRDFPTPDTTIRVLGKRGRHRHADVTRGQGAGLLKAANDLASEVLASANGLNNNRLPQAHSGVSRGRMPGWAGHGRATPFPTGILLPQGNFCELGHYTAVTGDY
jgi:hypothetical protein